jgi:hypothetical protein
MKSKFKNENCKYWGIKRKLLAISIAQILVVLGGAFLAFATDLGLCDIFAIGAIPFILLWYAEQYYRTELR